MAGTNINRVVLTGNLTRDPELRSTNSGLSVCSLRIAVNDRRKGQDGQWAEFPNYFNVTVFGGQAENVARYLGRGRGVAVDGRLRWREYEDKETKKNREAIEVIADSVQFLGGDGQGGGGRPPGGGESQGQGGGQGYGQGVDTGDFAPPGGGGGGGGGGQPPSDDDIPF